MHVVDLWTFMIVNIFGHSMPSSKLACMMGICSVQIAFCTNFALLPHVQNKTVSRCGL